MTRSRRAVLSALGGTALSGIASGSAAGASVPSVLGVSTAWEYVYDAPRWDQAMDVVATDDALYLAGTLGERPEKLSRIVRTTRPARGRPEASGDYFMNDELPVRKRVRDLVQRPDGGFDLVTGAGALARVSRDGQLRNEVGSDEWAFFPGGVVPRPDGSTLALGMDPDEDAPATAVVEPDGDVRSVRRFETDASEAWIASAIPGGGGGAFGVGVDSDADGELADRFYRVAHDGTLEATHRLDTPGGVLRADPVEGGAVFAGGQTDDGSRGYAFALDDAGAVRWETGFDERTVVRDVAGLADGSVVAVGDLLREDSPGAWVGKLGPGGDVAWQGRLATGRNANVNAVTADDGEVFLAGSVYASDGNPDDVGMYLAKLADSPGLGATGTAALVLGGAGVLAGGVVGMKRRLES